MATKGKRTASDNAVDASKKGIYLFVVKARCAYSLSFAAKANDKILEGCVICITGALSKTRKEITVDILSKGGMVTIASNRRDIT
jgi:NAD-dependent DNA ligase